MFRRLVSALRYARREEDFLPVLGSAVLLVLIGTSAYTFGEGWNPIDALYFAVCTLTTTSVSDPDLVLEHRWTKIFTIFYLLVGIGILVELLRRLGRAFVAVPSGSGARRGSRERGRSPAFALALPLSAQRSGR